VQRREYAYQHIFPIFFNTIK